MNISTIRSAIFSWVRTNTNSTIPIVWAEQNAPSPARPYITLKLSGPIRTAGADELRPNRDVGNTFAATGPRRLVLVVHFLANMETDPIGDTILGLAIGLNDSLGVASNKEALTAAGLAIAREGNIENVPVKTTQGWQPNVMFAVEFLAAASKSDPVTWIESVEGVEGDFL